MRNYIADLPGGTATTAVQIQGKGSLHRIFLSMLTTAVGKVEVSKSATSQIGTAQPTSDVIARFNCSATAANVNTVLDLASTLVSLVAFQTIYIHQTGAGNVGSINLMSSGT